MTETHEPDLTQRVDLALIKVKLKLSLIAVHLHVAPLPIMLSAALFSLVRGL